MPRVRVPTMIVLGRADAKKELERVAGIVIIVASRPEWYFVGGMGLTKETRRVTSMVNS